MATLARDGECSLCCPGLGCECRIRGGGSGLAVHEPRSQRAAPPAGRQRSPKDRAGRREGYGQGCRHPAGQVAHLLCWKDHHRTAVSLPWLAPRGSTTLWNSSECMSRPVAGLCKPLWWRRPLTTSTPPLAEFVVMDSCEAADLLMGDRCNQVQFSCIELNSAQIGARLAAGNRDAPKMGTSSCLMLHQQQQDGLPPPDGMQRPRRSRRRSNGGRGSCSTWRKSPAQAMMPTW